MGAPEPPHVPPSLPSQSPPPPPPPPASSVFTYLVVPFIGQLQNAFFSAANAATIGQQLQTLLDSYVRQGWEFYSIEKVSMEVAGLVSQNTSCISFDQVIVRRTA